jgi:hypothetical protein
MKFAIGVAADQTLVGVAVVGRPVARHLDDRATLEFTRSCTDGTRNANSMLYAAAWRVARELGYWRLITYTEAGESGASLRAAGLRPVVHRRGHRGWNRPSRPRTDPVRPVARTRWELTRATRTPTIRGVPKDRWLDDPSTVSRPRRQPSSPAGTHALASAGTGGRAVQPIDAQGQTNPAGRPRDTRRTSPCMSARAVDTVS